MDNKIEIINILDNKYDIRDNLTPNQRRFILISKFDREIQYGGFDQFYYSCYGAYSKETVDALNALEANDVARIVKEANSFWPVSIPSDQDERINALDDFSDELRQKLIDLHTQYTNTSDNLIELLYSFINDNSQDFGLIE